MVVRAFGEKGQSWWGEDVVVDWGGNVVLAHETTFHKSFVTAFGLVTGCPRIKICVHPTFHPCHLLPELLPHVLLNYLLRGTYNQTVYTEASSAFFGI
jgi:hypothetical protein